MRVNFLAQESIRWGSNSEMTDLDSDRIPLLSSLENEKLIYIVVDLT